MSIPYTILGNVTGSLISGSILNEQDSDLFIIPNKEIDVWFGLSFYDSIEISAYDIENDSFIAWKKLQQNKKYITNTLSYLDSLNIPQTFEYKILENPFTIYKNKSILVNIPQDLNDLGITDGNFKVLYNFTRDMAGSVNSPLIIKSISPSRTEIKLIPQEKNTLQYEAFCRKKFSTNDVSPVLISITQKCPYDEIYSTISKLPEYKIGINYLKFIYFLNDDGSVIRFLRNLYEDYVEYTKLTEEQINSGFDPTRITRIQGIRSYFSNYLLSTNEQLTDFDSIEQKFSEFVNIRLNKRFGIFNNSAEIGYKEARKFCFDFFFKFFYKKTIDPIRENYELKYFSYLKNVLNFGNNKYYTILNHDFLDERVNPDDPLTLIVKLSTSLPQDVAIKDSCWVSNYGMTPFILTVILQNPVKYKTIKISPANFGATSQFITSENINKLYSYQELNSNDVNVESNISIQKNIKNLNVDYSKFENFIIFSSANTRLEIFENKVKSWSALSHSLNNLENRYNQSLSSSVIYPYYSIEKERIQSQMFDIINSFDGYESYLFNSGKYKYVVESGSFISSSYVEFQKQLAQEYDKNNKDNLVANTPEYIVNDSNNTDYLTFLQMIGHHFDNIYTYISALPIERQLKNEISSSIPTNTLKQLLLSFGWNIDDIIGSLDIDEVYLNSLNGATYNTLSADQRLQIIWNRILITLPGIYKTKGTEECVKYLLSCYGLPSSLITVREYGGIDSTEESKPTFKLDEKIFMMRFSGVSDYVEGPIPQSVRTVEFKFAVEEPHRYINRNHYPLFEVIAYPDTDPSNSVWEIGITKVPGQYMGQVEFRMGSGSTGAKITSSILPIFNGQIFNVMVRKNDVEDDFEYTTDSNIIPRTYDLVIQRNEDGRRIFYSTSSAIFYEQDNISFSKYGRFRLGNGRPGGSFVGTLDKLLIWDIPISDSDWENHVNDINSTGINEENSYKNLWVKLGVDYPINLHQNLNGSSSMWMDNQSPYYYIPNYYIGGLSGSINPSLYSASLNIIDERWSFYYPMGSVEIVARNFPEIIHPNFTSSYDCGWKSGSAYPYSYREYVYQQDIDASKYGPNKFKNQKIRKVDYSLESRLDAEDKSSELINQTISGESNQIGFFIDPQDQKNKEILRYIGKSGIMDLISDPSNLYLDRYPALINKNKEFHSTGNHQTYFTEMLTVYKFYFDKSIFQAIKNVLPARANVFTGVVIEPTILERPKYQNKPIIANITDNRYSCNINPIKNFSINSLWSDFNINYSLNDGRQSMTSQSILALKNTMPSNYISEIDISYVNNPTQTKSDNIQKYIIEPLDNVQFGNFASFENYPRLWELEGGAPSNWPVDGIAGSTTYDDPDDLFVIGPDQNQVVRTDDPANAGGYNTGSHQILYYLLKVWEKYYYHYKSGPYFHTNNPRANTHVSNSIYLYKYITVSEPFMRKYVYWYDKVPFVNGNDDPSYTFFGTQYLHRSSTFIGTPDQTVSNVYAININPFSKTFDLAFRPDNVYFEIVRGYPRNHFTHKLMTFSNTSYARFLSPTTREIFIKGRNTKDTTVGEDGIADGTYPVQSFNTSNVNAVNTTNVLQFGINPSGVGSVIPQNT